MTDEEYIERERQVAEDVKTILREFAREMAEEEDEAEAEAAKKTGK